MNADGDRTGGSYIDGCLGDDSLLFTFTTVNFTCIIIVVIIMIHIVIVINTMSTGKIVVTYKLAIPISEAAKPITVPRCS